MLSGPSATPPVAPPCGLSDYVSDAPIDAATSKPSTLGNGVRAGLEMAGLLALGAGVGAVISKEHRGRNAGIGAGVGAVAGAGVVAYQFSKWKADGGKTHQPGACASGAAATAEQGSKGGTAPASASGAPGKGSSAPSGGSGGSGGSSAPPAKGGTRLNLNPFIIAFKPGDACTTPDGSAGTFNASLVCVSNMPILM
jgi:hypothetical protein